MALVRSSDIERLCLPLRYGEHHPRGPPPSHRRPAYQVSEFSMKSQIERADIPPLPEPAGHIAGYMWQNRAVVIACTGTPLRAGEEFVAPSPDSPTGRACYCP